MSTQMPPQLPPPGFEEFGFNGPFNKALGQIYRKQIDDHMVCGFEVTEAQTNSMGICHGGALMTFADIAFAVAIASKLPKYSPMPTIELSIDFISPGRPGMWLQSQVKEVQLAYASGFISGVIKHEDTVILHAKGRYKIQKESRG